MHSSLKLVATECCVRSKKVFVGHETHSPWGRHTHTRDAVEQPQRALDAVFPRGCPGRNQRFGLLKALLAHTKALLVYKNQFTMETAKDAEPPREGPDRRRSGREAWQSRPRWNLL